MQAHYLPRDGNPFSLSNRDDYRRWADHKLAAYASGVQSVPIEINDPRNVSSVELAALTNRCRTWNMVTYACPKTYVDKEAIRALGRQCGLERLDHNLCADEDGIAAIQVMPDRESQEYVPYTNRSINWHTDGYYNASEKQIRGVIMHCVSQAAHGGGNTLLDPEIVYILVRDENPDYIAALMRPDAFTIPANMDGNHIIRPEQTGPVFSVDPTDGSLHMRYTARKRYIVWKNAPITQEAAHFLDVLLARPLSYRFTVRLERGQGILCNNVLHTREAFRDDPESRQRRLLMRARYYDRIAGT